MSTPPQSHCPSICYFQRELQRAYNAYIVQEMDESC